MKKILILLLLSIVAIPAPAQTWTHYNPAARVPWLKASIYSRDAYDWWVQNEQVPLRLFLNGVYQPGSDEAGGYDLDLPAAWTYSTGQGVKIGVVDLATAHGYRIVDLAQKTAPGATVTLYPVSRYYSDVVAAAMAQAVDDGCRVVVLATGWATPPTEVFEVIDDSRRVVFCCAVVDSPGNYDVTPDYPSSWGFEHVLPTACVDMAGNWYWSNTGTGCLAAPGRVIPAYGTYSDGTSYAVGISAGAIALRVAQRPLQSGKFHVQRALQTASNQRIRPAAMVMRRRATNGFVRRQW